MFFIVIVICSYHDTVVRFILTVLILLTGIDFFIISEDFFRNHLVLILVSFYVEVYVGIFYVDLLSFSIWLIFILTF